MLDFDHDGLLDLFLPGGGRFSSTKQPEGRDSSLYRQKQKLSSGLPAFVEMSAVANVVNADSSKPESLPSPVKA